MSNLKKRIPSDTKINGTLETDDKITGKNGLNIKENNASIIETDGNNIQIDKATIVGANFGVATGNNGLAVTSSSGTSVIGNIEQTGNGATAQFKATNVDSLTSSGDIDVQGTIKNTSTTGQGVDKPVIVDDALSVTGSFSTPHISDNGERVILDDTTVDSLTINDANIKSKVIVTNGSGTLVPDANVTIQQLDYLSEVTSSVQGQLDTLTGNLAQEVLDRGNADTGLSNRITAIEDRITPWDDANDKLAKTSDVTALQTYTNTELAKKRDKITASHTSNPVVYTQSYDSDTQSYQESLYDLTNNTTGSTIPVRDLNGKLTATTPSSNDGNNTVATKEYTDTKVSDEATARTDADNTLDGKISDEATARGNADNTLQGYINTINGKIPSEASSSNQLADKSYVTTGLATKQDTITGGATTIVSSNLTTGKALVSDSNGKVATHSDTTTTELGYVHGVTSAIQTQLNDKIAKNFSTGLFDGASAVSITQSGASLQFTTKNTNTGSAGTSVTVALPVATNSLAGIATASQIAQIEQNTADISALSGKSTRYAISLDVSNLSGSVLQSALTTKWRDASGQSTGDPDDYTTLVNLYSPSEPNNHEYTWMEFNSVTEWVDRGASTVAIATNTTLGIVMGTPNPGANVHTSDGNVYVDGNGQMSVLGWDYTVNRISTNESSITNLSNNKVDKLITSPAGTYKSVTVNAQGQVTSGSNPTTLSGYGITDAVQSNASITGAQKCKITYDAKGLVTAGDDLSASDIPSLAISKITNLQTTLDGKMATDLSNINVYGTKSDGKTVVWDNTNSRWQYEEAGKVDDVVNSAGQSVVTNKVAHLPSGTVQLVNQSVTFVSNTDNATNDEYPYRASVSLTGVTSSTYAEVVYDDEQATSLNFATFCDTATNVIYLYSRTNVGTVTIPTISIGMDYSDITIDATPTSGSNNAVSSGGVYTALAGKQNAITISDQAPSGGSDGDIWIQY